MFGDGKDPNFDGFFKFAIFIGSFGTFLLIAAAYVIYVLLSHFNII